MSWNVYSSDVSRSPLVFLNMEILTPKSSRYIVAILKTVDMKYVMISVKKNPILF